MSTGQLLIPDEGRAMGVRVAGAKGSGKTILVARGIAFNDFRRGIGGALLDPVGRAVDEFLGRFLRLPPEEQLLLGQRLRYIDMAGLSGYITPRPVYHRGEGDSHFVVSQRPLEVWRRSDPALGAAPIQGLNAVLNTGTFVGMALSAMGCRLTEADSLISDRDRWRERLQAVARDDPSSRPAVDWLLTQLPKVGTNDWRSQVASYLNKVHQIVLDDPSRAIYGASEPGFSWEDVANKGLFVLIDFRGILFDELKTFGLLWNFRSIVDFLKRRGPGKHHPPFSLIIEELTYFLSTDYRQQDVLAADFEDLSARLSRNTKFWLTITHQELNQLSRRMANVLMACGTQIFSSTSDLEDGAEVWAKRFERFDPKKVKAVRPQWMHGDRWSPDYIVDWQPVFETMQEQTREAAQDKYMQVPPFSFWASISPREGKLGGTPVRFTIKHRVGTRWLDEEQVAAARQQLAERDGRRIADVLMEISARGPRPSAPPARQRE